MNVIIALVHVFLIFFLAYQLRPKNEELHKIFWTALIFKLISGLLLGVIYIYYYKEGDTLLFFGDAVTLAKLARHNVVEYGSFLWQGDGFSSIGRTLHLHEPRSLLFVKIVSVFSLITADNYWVTSLYLSFLAFLSSWKFVTTMNHFFPEHRMASIVSFLFVPSVVFWTAGVLKDGLAMAAIFFIAHVFITLWMNDKVAIASWIGLLISVIILWALKYYYAAILIPILLTSLVIRLLISPALALKKPVVEFFWWSCVFSISLLSVTLLHPNFKSEIFLILFSEIMCTTP